MKRLPETDRLEYQLLQVGRRIRAQHVQRGLVLVLTGLGLGLLAIFAGDVIGRFPFPVRLALVAGLVGYGLWWFRRHALLPARRPYDAQEVSLLVERHDTSLQSRLISTLQFQAAKHLAPGTSADLVEGLVRQTFQRLAGARFQEIIDRRWRGRALRNLLLTATLIGLVAWGLPDYGLAFLRRLVDPQAAYPTRTRITEVVLPGIVPLGDPVPITARATGRLPELGRLLVIGEEGERLEYDLRHDGDGGYAVTIAGLAEPATCYLEIGDAERGPIRLEPVPRPQLEGLAITVEAPAYAGEEPRLETSGNLRVLTGSRLRMRFTITKPCPDFRLLPTVLGEQGLIPEATSEDGRVWTCSYLAEESLGFTLAFQDERGLEAVDVPQYRITAIRDRPPVIHIADPRGTSELPPAGRRPLRFTASDDIGLGSIRIEYAIEDELAEAEDNRWAASEAPRQLYQRIDGVAGKRYEHDGWWDNQRLRLRPGQVLRFWVVVEDNRPQPQRSESHELSIRILSSEEFSRLMLMQLNEAVDAMEETVTGIKASERELENIQEHMSEHMSEQ